MMNAGHCGHCGCWHDLAMMCPRIKRVEYFPNGMIKEVEYHVPLQQTVPQQPLMGFAGLPDKDQPH